MHRQEYRSVAEAFASIELFLERFTTRSGYARHRGTCLLWSSKRNWQQLLEAHGCVFSGMAESIGPMYSTRRLPHRLPYGVSAPGKERDGRSTLCSSSTMSSGRLYLDQVGRHQSLSLLRRQSQRKACQAVGNDLPFSCTAVP